MGRPCIACNHPQRSTFEAAIYQGRSIRGTALDYRMDDASLRRHMKLHARRDVQAAVAQRNGDAGESLLSRIQASRIDLQRILKAAEGTNELTVAVNAIQGGLRALELEGRVTGELASGSTQVNVLLGVRVDVAKQAVEQVTDAQSLPGRAVVERAAQVIRMWNASADESEQVEVIAPRARTRSEAQVLP
jgi:hypothetical protein